jgi:hypothetical protein
MRFNRTASSALLVAGFLVAVPARALASDLLEDPRLSEVKADLSSILEDATAKGLPAELLEAKIREGLVKKVAAHKIVTATKVLEGQCEKASKLLGKAGIAPSAKEIGLVVSLAAAGLSDGDAKRLFAGLVASKLDSSYREKALLITLAITEKGTPAKDAVTQVLSIVAKQGEKGLDGWGKKKKSSDKPKPKGPSKGNGKGKPTKPHAK